MGRCLLLAADPADLDAIRRCDAIRRRGEHENWRFELVHSGAWLGRLGPRPPSLTRAGGWLLAGDVIPRRGRSPLSAGEPAAPDDLLARVWGRYVGLRFDRPGWPELLLRDPSGAHDLWVWALAEGLLVASSALPDWLFDAVSPDWSIDEDRLREALHDPLLVWDQPLLRGPLSIPPGGVWRRSRPREVEPLWRPVDFALDRRRRPPSDRQAADALRAAIEEAVAGLAGLSDALGAEVSGGLDSSIVATTLKSAGARVRLWLNACGPDPESDETPYVDALAQRLDIDPLRHGRGPEPFTLDQLAALSPGGRPGLNALDAHHGVAWAKAWRGADIELVLTGKGGDSLFIQGADADIFVDEWRRIGPRALSDPALFRLARWSEQSVWSYLAAAGRGVTPIPANPLLAPSAGPVRHHPWLEGLEAIGPAKRHQISGVVNGLMFSAPSAQTEVVDLAHPLLAQPVVETCLRLTARQLTLGRRDRALVREAFRDRLPATIVDRRSKGDMTRFYGRELAMSLPVLRPWLLEGRLAHRGLLNLSSLDHRLTADALMQHGGYGPIMVLAAFESWVRTWEARLRL